MKAEIARDIASRKAEIYSDPELLRRQKLDLLLLPFHLKGDHQTAITYRLKELLVDDKIDSEQRSEKLVDIGFTFYEHLIDYDNAITYYNNALALDISNELRVETLRKKARALNAQGAYTEALTCCNKGLALYIYKQEASLWELKGSIYYCMGEYRKAIFCYRYACKFDSSHWRRFRSLKDEGIACYALGEYKESERCFKECLKIGVTLRKEAEIYNLLGKVYYAQQQFEKAIEYYRKMLEPVCIHDDIKQKANRAIQEAEKFQKAFKKGEGFELQEMKSLENDNSSTPSPQFKYCNSYWWQASRQQTQEDVSVAEEKQQHNLAI